MQLGRWFNSAFRGRHIRQRIASEYASGTILDIGYAQAPNPFLKGDIIGYDIEPPRDDTYKKTITADVNDMKKHVKENSIDCIVATEFIEHIDGHLRFFKDCNRVLRKNGYLIISTPTPVYYRTMLGNMFFKKGTVGTKDHISAYLPRVLNNVAEKTGFMIVDVRPASLFYLPLITYQLVYIYRKK